MRSEKFSRRERLQRIVQKQISKKIENNDLTTDQWIKKINDYIGESVMNYARFRQIKKGERGLNIVEALAIFVILNVDSINELFEQDIATLLNSSNRELENLDPERDVEEILQKLSVKDAEILRNALKAQDAKKTGVQTDK